MPPLDVVVTVHCHCLCPVMHPIRRFTCTGEDVQLRRHVEQAIEEVGEPVCYPCRAAIAMQRDPKDWPAQLARADARR